MAELTQLAGELREFVNDYHVDFTATLANNLEAGSPKDSTLASKSWKTAVNDVPFTDPIPQEADAAALDPREDALRTLAGYDVSQGRIILYNKQRYVRRLEYDGWSPQAPDGFIEQAILETLAELD